jgi:hypothetical protein
MCVCERERECMRVYGEHLESFVELIEGLMQIPHLQHMLPLVQV